MTKNIVWINVLKAVCIIAVYFVHCQSYYGYLIPFVNHAIIHPVYVNAFFFVSGYLFFRKQLNPDIISKGFHAFISNDGKTLLENIFFRLVIPSIVFSAIEFFPKYMISGESFGITELLYETVGGGTYWFVSALVMVEIYVFFMLLFRVANIGFYILLSLVLFFIAQLLTSGPIVDLNAYTEIWAYKKGMLAIPFFTFGGLYFKLEDMVDYYMKKTYVRCVLVFAFILLFSVYDSADCLVSMNSINFIGLMGSIAGILLLISICRKFKDYSALTFIGKNSICFYMMSGAAPIVCSKIVQKIHYFSMPDAVYLTVVFIASLAIAFLGTYIIVTYLPFLTDVRTLFKRKHVQ